MSARTLHAILEGLFALFVSAIGLVTAWRFLPVTESGRFEEIKRFTRLTGDELVGALVAWPIVVLSGGLLIRAVRIARREASRDPEVGLSPFGTVTRQSVFLGRVGPGAAGVEAAAAVGLVVAGVVASGTVNPYPELLAVTIGGGALAGAIVAGWRLRFKRSGRMNIIVDTESAIMTLPATGSDRRTEEIPFASIRAIHVDSAGGLRHLNIDCGTGDSIHRVHVVGRIDAGFVENLGKWVQATIRINANPHMARLAAMRSTDQTNSDAQLHAHAPSVPTVHPAAPMLRVPPTEPIMASLPVLSDDEVMLPEYSEPVPEPEVVETIECASQEDTLPIDENEPYRILPAHPAVPAGDIPMADEADEAGAGETSDDQDVAATLNAIDPYAEMRARAAANARHAQFVAPAEEASPGDSTAAPHSPPAPVPTSSVEPLAAHEQHAVTSNSSHASAEQTAAMVTLVSTDDSGAYGAPIPVATGTDAATGAGTVPMEPGEESAAPMSPFVKSSHDTGEGTSGVAFGNTKRKGHAALSGPSRAMAFSVPALLSMALIASMVGIVVFGLRVDPTMSAADNEEIVIPAARKLIGRTAEGGVVWDRTLKGRWTWIEYVAPWSKVAHEQSEATSRLLRGPAPAENVTIMTVLVAGERPGDPATAAEALRWTRRHSREVGTVLYQDTVERAVPRHALLNPDGQIVFEESGFIAGSSIARIVRGFVEADASKLPAASVLDANEDARDATDAADTDESISISGDAGTTIRVDGSTP